MPGFMEADSSPNPDSIPPLNCTETQYHSNKPNIEPMNIQARPKSVIGRRFFARIYHDQPRLSKLAEARKSTAASGPASKTNCHKCYECHECYKYEG